MKTSSCKKFLAYLQKSGKREQEKATKTLVQFYPVAIVSDKHATGRSTLTTESVRVICVCNFALSQAYVFVKK
jgi:hypothetical protein